MSIIELLLIGVGLSMDAFAVSICKGLTMRKMEWNKAFLCGIYFGFFQFLMPVIGFFLGYGFKDIIENFDHWVAFVVLAAIGVSMIRSAMAEDSDIAEGFGVKTMITLAVATSIDALAVGISFAFLRLNIWLSAGLIGITTFTLSVIGVKVGSVFGTRYKKKAEIAGGVILIIIGLKILIEHLGLI